MTKDELRYKGRMSQFLKELQQWADSRGIKVPRSQQFKLYDYLQAMEEPENFHFQTALEAIRSHVNLVNWDSLAHDQIEECVKRSEIGVDQSLYLHNAVTIEGMSLEIATGRAFCRVTGDKIPKGELVLKGLYDFTGAGSYTCNWVYIWLRKYHQIRKDELKQKQAH